MWGEFLSAENQALVFFERLPDFLWGAALMTLSLLAARLLLRAAFCSCLGREEGSVLATLAECLAASLLGLKLYQQPGAVFVLIGYFAALARTFTAV